MTFIAVPRQWSGEYSCQQLPKFYDRFIAEIGEDDSKIANLECEVNYDYEDLENVEILMKGPT